MLKYVNHDIVFQEFPDEVTLAVNLSRCPCACPGCHSIYLWGDVGEELTESRLLALVESYGQTITCVALMGGDGDPHQVLALLHRLKQLHPHLHTGWYSGRQELPTGFDPLTAPTYVKLGPWCSELGGLSSPTTNQRLFRYAPDGTATDITACFWHKGLPM